MNMTGSKDPTQLVIPQVSKSGSIGVQPMVNVSNGCKKRKVEGSELWKEGGEGGRISGEKKEKKVAKVE